MCYNISGWYGDVYLPTIKYLYYSKRDAIRQFREHYNVKGKHLPLHIEPSAWL